LKLRLALLWQEQCFVTRHDTGCEDLLASSGAVCAAGILIEVHALQWQQGQLLEAAFSLHVGFGLERLPKHKDEGFCGAVPS
jgi:hypothetical protein